MRISMVVVGVAFLLLSACGRAGDPAPGASPGAAGPAAAAGPAMPEVRKKIARQLAECAGCQAASKKAEDRASEASDKIGAAQCEICQGYWAANGNDKNGGLHYSKKCQQCARMEAAGRDGACDACQKAHEPKRKSKRDKN